MAESSGSQIVFSMESGHNAFLAGEFETALKHFFGCMIMLPEDRRHLYEDQFAAAIHGWVALNKDNASRAISLYPQIKKLFPNTIRTKMALVRAVQSTDQRRWLLNCLPICKDAQELATRLEDIVNLRMTRVNLATHPFPSWHIRMVNCHLRNQAFLKALQQSIKSRSTTVFDIGSGTGLLSMMAARSTNLVIGLEENIPLAMISREIIKRNGMSGRIRIHSRNSLDHKTLQKADVVVSETLDCCVFGERIVETFMDAHTRFATEKTIFIPNEATVYVRLFSCREIFDIHAQDYGGVRYRSEYVKIGDEESELPYWCCNPAEFSSFEYLTMPEELHTAYFGTAEELRYSLVNTGAVRIFPTKDGVAHGFAVHFTADLTGDGVCINSAESKAWDIGIFPFKEPCVVKKGEEIPVTWKLVSNRFDVYNEFYPEELQDKDHSDRLNIHYHNVSMESIQKIRDDSYFKQMMAEIDASELPYTEDISNAIPVQVLLNDIDSRRPAKAIVANWIRADGSLDQDAFFQIEEFAGIKDHITKITPSRIRIVGRLFQSDHVHRQARPDVSAHCGLDLSMLRSFNLREMRDIRLTERPDIQMMSDELTLYDFKFTADAFRQTGLPTTSREIKVRTTGKICDGVIYEIEVLGIRNTKLRPCAAFLFPERFKCEQEVTLVCDYHQGEILVTLKDHYY